MSDLVTIARLAATRDGLALALALERTSVPPAALASALARHTLVRPVLLALDAALASSRVPPPIVTALEPWSRRAWPSPRQLLDVHARADAALGEAGIPALALKGLCFAHRLYGGTGNRPQFDLDLLVRRADFARARSALRRHGARQIGYDAHSRSFELEGVKIDLHHRLTRALAFHVDEDVCWRTAAALTLDGVPLRTLSDEWALVQLLQAAYEDLGQGAAKLRQLMDVFLLVRQMDPATDWDAFFDARCRERFDVVSANLLALMTTLFDAAADWPRLSTALARRSGTILDQSTREAQALLSAPRKHAANLRWFAALYPGSMALYMAWFWYHGFPANVSTAALTPLRAAMPAIFGRPRAA